MAKAKKIATAKTPDEPESVEAKKRVTTMTPEAIEALASELRNWANLFDGQAEKMRERNQPTADILGLGLMDRAFENVNLYFGNVVGKVKQTDTPKGVK